MNISFLIPINEGKKTATGTEQIHHGDIEVNATVNLDPEFPNEPYPDVEYDSINWRGVDILPLLDNIGEGAGDRMMDFIISATVDYAHYLKSAKQGV